MMESRKKPDTINSDDRISEIAALILQAILRYIVVSGLVYGDKNELIAECNLFY